MGAELKRAILVLLVLTLLTGAAYPLLVTGVAQVFLPGRAGGSLITVDGKPVGSILIGQQFDDPRYFWGRPSATVPVPYNAAASSGSNNGPTNPAEFRAVKARLDALRAADPGNAAAVPVDLVTASASGLDPHISPAAAAYQVARVARLRNVSESAVRRLVAASTRGRTFGLLGEPRVNVLALNLSLDRLTRGPDRPRPVVPARPPQ